MNERDFIDHLVLPRLHGRSHDDYLRLLNDYIEHRITKRVGDTAALAQLYRVVKPFITVDADTNKETILHKDEMVRVHAYSENTKLVHTITKINDYEQG